MKNKLTKIMGVLTIVGLVATGSVAYAQPPKKKSAVREVFLQGLNLTSEQDAALRANDEASSARLRELRAQYNESQKALSLELKKPGVTRAELDVFLKKISDLEAELLLNRVDNFFFLKRILTSEQFEQVQQNYHVWRPKSAKA